MGENLAYAAGVREAHAALMASPPHRENILYPGYRHVGIGVTDGAGQGVVVVEEFTNNIHARRPPSPGMEPVRAATRP